MTSPFITDDFLLHSETARHLYHVAAKPASIFDYHCHLPPKQIAENYQFRNLSDLWLAGDHYKWRSMRANGIPENFITGAASDREKFQAWARTVPYTLRNPLYHWTHLELTRYFGITTLLNESTAEAVWNEANEKITTPDFWVHSLLKRSNVKVICTTDDPVDSLEYHRQIAQSDLPFRVYPTFRPDRALQIRNIAAWDHWLDLLAESSGISTDDFSGFLEALKQRHDHFHSLGGRLSDHGLENCPDDDVTEADARAIFARAREGSIVSDEEATKFASFLMLFFGYLDHEKGWTKQLHLGAMRNNNTRLFRTIGPDTGFDSIGDFRQGRALARYLDRLDSTNQLPKVIVYNLNPADNYLFAALIGNFQDGSIAGKIQFGSGWWFLDQKEAMEWQLNALSNLGLLRRFVGMLTDSRSFLSYTRHEYFRRVLCNLLGRDIENGELPNDIPLLETLVKEVSFENAAKYFSLDLP